MIKPIPEPTAQVTIPPNLDHNHFEDCANHPFQHDASDFELVNAWWLAESSLLAYAEADFATAQFANAGLQLAGAQPLSGTSTQCYVAHNDDFVIVAFRGTQVLKPGSEKDTLESLKDAAADIYADAKFKLVDSGQAGMIHRGFKEALAEVSDDLSQVLNKLRTENPNRPVWFTGHSLGAALATLAAQQFGPAKGLYTFGSPLVGDKEFAADFNVNYFRFVNHNDVVTRVPPFGPVDPPQLKPVMYEHVGQVRYIDKNHEIQDSMAGEIDLVDRIKKSFSEVLAGRAISAPIIEDGIPGMSLIDHTPLYYALNIWNQYDASI